MGSRKKWSSEVRFDGGQVLLSAQQSGWGQNRFSAGGQNRFSAGGQNRFSAGGQNRFSAGGQNRFSAGGQNRFSAASVCGAGVFSHL